MSVARASLFDRGLNRFRSSTALRSMSLRCMSLRCIRPLFKGPLVRHLKLTMRRGKGVIWEDQRVTRHRERGKERGCRGGSRAWLIPSRHCRLGSSAGREETSAVILRRLLHCQGKA